MKYLRKDLATELFMGQSKLVHLEPPPTSFWKRLLCSHPVKLFYTRIDYSLDGERSYTGEVCMACAKIMTEKRIFDEPEKSVGTTA